jgi:hypothetical protein
VTPHSPNRPLVGRRDTLSVLGASAQAKWFSALLLQNGDVRGAARRLSPVWSFRVRRQRWWSMRDPDKSGRGGRAWQLKLVPRTKDQEAALAVWLVHAPGSHRFWPWKLIGLIHLRPIEGVREATKKCAEAEYELMVISVDPEQCPEPDPDEQVGFPLLEGPEVIEQFHCNGNDHDAVRICEAAIDAIVTGTLVPDSDWRSTWKAAIAKTAEHFRSGAHVEH